MQTYETAAQITDHARIRLPWTAIVRAAIAKQVAAEIFGMPGYRFTLKGLNVNGFVATPHEVRPADASIGKAMMSGRFVLAGARMSVQGSGDPWNRPSPNRIFAQELHRFSWLAPMMTQGIEGSKEAMRLFLLWHQTFKTWTPFAWSEDVLPRRLINLSLFARRLCSQAHYEQTQILAQSIAEQSRHMLRMSNNPAHLTTKAIALCVAGCVLEGKVGDGLRKKGLQALPKALRRVVLADGSHVSRSTEQGLDLLFDLLLIEDALAQRGMVQPEYLSTYITRLSRFVRTLTHPDGSLCAFQGSQSLSASQMATAFVHEDNRPIAASALPLVLDHGRYHRLLGRSLLVFVDTGEAKAGPHGYASCDHPMSFEVSGGRDKLIVGSGWNPDQCEQHALRTINAASSLTLGEGSILSPITGKFGELLNFALGGYRYRIRHRRVDSESSGTLLEMEHEGWRPKYGVKHERRLYIDPVRDELRGEDRLVQLESKPEAPLGVPYAIRFVLHPDVQASLARDKKSVLLRAPGGRGWWLRHDSREVSFEKGTVYEKGVARKTTTIALKGVCRLDGATRVRWKLAPAEN